MEEGDTAEVDAGHEGRSLDGYKAGTVSMKDEPR